MSTLLYAHTALTVQPQRLTHNGREVLIAPCSMIVEGVLNGGLVTAAEIRACRWDGIPIVINHPHGPAGEDVSANAPDILAQYGVGQVFHTQCVDAGGAGPRRVRAQAELWVEIARVTTLGGDAQQAFTMLETQTPLEVSTAFYSDAEQTAGTFHGAPYREIHHNLRADHLALLPNAVGACNWQQGCGAPRLNAAGCRCQPTTQESPMPLQEPQTGWRRFVAVLSDFVRSAETDLVANARATARRPTYTGTERTPWSAPTLQEYTHALFHGGTLPASVSALTDAQKRQIAAHTLLGDEAAGTFAELSFFPVVNPGTGKLNDRALHAVLSGRGSQANIAAPALASVQTMARDLLNSEFGTNLTANQTDTDIREALYGALARELNVDVTPIFIDSVDTATQTFTYRLGEQLKQRGWTVDATGVLVLSPDIQDVQRVTTYLPVGDPGLAADTLPAAMGGGPGMGMVNSQQGERMATPTVVAAVTALVANVQTPWTEADRNVLETMSEAQLARLVPLVGVGAATPLPEPTTVDEALALLPTHLREAVGGLAREHDQRKQTALAALVANKCPVGETTLRTMALAELEGLVRALTLTENYDYAGRGAPHLRVRYDENVPPAAPNTFQAVVDLQKARGMR